nr:hypothetical protein [Tanacetum cinerariifolium]
MKGVKGDDDKKGWDAKDHNVPINSVKRKTSKDGNWDNQEDNGNSMDDLVDDTRNKEETRQDYNYTRSGFKNARIVPEDNVTIPSDAIKTYKRRCQEFCDGVRM